MTIARSYRASYSTGVYGSYTVGYNMDTNVIIKPASGNNSKHIHQDVNWMIYEENEEHVINIKTSNLDQLTNDKTKFQKRDRRIEHIINGYKYNVRLISEWTIKSKQNKSETCTFYICNGSVVSFSGECIVNAANESLLFEFAVSGGGVDRAISIAGGDALNILRKSVPIIKGTKYTRCKTGDAKITLSGYPHNQLKCDYVIHAVGPNYNVMSRMKTINMQDIDKLLYNAYAKTMSLCKQHNIKSVGFCLISSSIFRGTKSLHSVLQIGLTAIRDSMFSGIEVYLIAYTHKELKCLTEIAPKVFGMKYIVHCKIDGDDKQHKIQQTCDQ